MHIQIHIHIHIYLYTSVNIHILERPTQEGMEGSTRSPSLTPTCMLIFLIGANKVSLDPRSGRTGSRSEIPFGALRLHGFRVAPWALSWPLPTPSASRPRAAAPACDQGLLGRASNVSAKTSGGGTWKTHAFLDSYSEKTSPLRQKKETKAPQVWEQVGYFIKAFGLISCTKQKNTSVRVRPH